MAITDTIRSQGHNQERPLFRSDDTDVDDDDDDCTSKTAASAGKTKRIHNHHDRASMDCSHPASTIAPAKIPGIARTINAAKGGFKNEHDRTQALNMPET
jgi:hypothetical protein